MSHITRDGAIDIVIKSTAQPITKMQTNNDFNEVNSNFNQTGQLIRYDQPSSAQKDHKYSSSSKYMFNPAIEVQTAMEMCKDLLPVKK